MIDTIKNNIINLVVASSLLVAAIFGTLALAPAAGAQNIQDNLCSGAGTLSLNRQGQPGGANCNTVTQDSNSGLNSVIARIVNILSVIVGIIAVIMIIIGGFRYITSGGDSNNVGAAKNTILYAIVGLIIVALAQVIVRFVLSASTFNGNA